MRKQKLQYSLFVKDYIWKLALTRHLNDLSGWVRVLNKGLAFVGTKEKEKITGIMSWAEVCEYYGILDLSTPYMKRRTLNIVSNKGQKPPYAVLGKGIILDALSQGHGHEFSGWVLFPESYTSSSGFQRIEVKNRDILPISLISLEGSVQVEKLSWIEFCEELEIFPQELIDRYK